MSSPALKAPSSREKHSYPPIGEPLQDLASLQQTCRQLKEAVEVLTGVRGRVEDSVPGAKRATERNLEHATGKLAARVWGSTAVFEDSGQTIAEWITGVEVTANDAQGKADDATASGQIKFVASGGPTGYSAEYQLTLTAGSAYTGLSLLAKNDGTSEIWLESRALMFTDTGTGTQVFEYDGVDGVFRFNVPVEILGSQIGDNQIDTAKLVGGAVTSQSTASGTINTAATSTSLTTRAGTKVLILAQIHVFDDSGETSGFSPITTRSYPIKVDGSSVGALEAVDALSRAENPSAGNYNFFFLPTSVSGHVLVTGLTAAAHTFEIENPYAFDVHARITVIEFAK